MSDDDFNAACELALDFKYFAAAKFLRSQIGLGLIECGQLAYRLSQEHPDSILGNDVRDHGYLPR